MINTPIIQTNDLIYSLGLFRLRLTLATLAPSRFVRSRRSSGFTSTTPGQGSPNTLGILHGLERRVLSGWRGTVGFTGPTCHEVGGKAWALQLHTKENEATRREGKTTAVQKEG